MKQVKGGVHFILIILSLEWCNTHSQIQAVCEMCFCTKKLNEDGILFVNCTHPPRFERITEHGYTNKMPDIYLSMERMNLTSIQRFVKFETYNVKDISLNYNNIKIIPSHIFSKFSNLTSLSLVDNEIENVTQESFSGLENLKLLNISYNALKTFDVAYLNDLKELEILDLRNNMLFNFGSTSSLPKMKLKYLDIGQNKLTSLPEKALKLLNELKELNLKENQIKSIQKLEFKNQIDLENLDLSNNQLTEIDSESFPVNNKLKVLHLKHNLISNTTFVEQLSSLITIDLSYNSITSLNTTFWSRSLIELNLANNGMTGLDDVLKGLPQLQKLDASWNQCQKIPGVTNPNLKRLILDYNAIISVLPSRPEGNGSLTYLSLSDLPHLKTLQKGALNGLFSRNYDNKSCAKLVIKRTGLQFIEKGALNDFNLCEVDLSWNDLIELPDAIFDWDRLKTIDIQGNPWHCTCSMQWLLDKVVTTMYESHQELLQNLRCQTPKHLEGTRLVHWFNKSEPMLCKEKLKESNVITISSSPAMIALDITFGIIAVALVATGFYLQRKLIKQKRLRKNRRF